MIVDGDTIEVKIGTRKHTVRYIGVDTPTLCYAKETLAYHKSLVNGKTIRLVKDVSETDKYGRLLRYVYLQDGRMVNELLLEGGYAHLSTLPPDVLHVDRFLALQRKARESSAGLWSACAGAGMAATGDAPCDCAGPDLDCEDFTTQKAAQACWDFCGGEADGPNPHRLDGNDKDGVVCESSRTASGPPAGSAPATATPAPAKAPCDCAGPDLDCKDFSTQQAAQACWDFCGGKAGGPNPHRLDGNDKDGIVCESLP
jgi:micrococcal nuclease